MRTILSIEKPGFSDVDTKYNIESLSDLFYSIEDALKINPLIEKIRVIKNEKIDVEEWMFKNGFDFSNYSNKGEIRFRGFVKWVYFKKNVPVFFDSACSGIETPPHTCTFNHDEYKTLDFDRYQKIKF